MSEEWKQIFAYFNGQEVVGEYAEKLREEVDRMKKNKEWRLEYMTLQMREMEKYEEGREKGIEEGLEKGIEKGIAKGIAKGIEKGRKEGREEGIEEGVEKGIRMMKSVLRLDAEGYAVSDIATELQISEEEVKRILEE